MLQASDYPTFDIEHAVDSSNDTDTAAAFGSPSLVLLICSGTDLSLASRAAVDVLECSNCVVERWSDATFAVDPAERWGRAHAVLVMAEATDGFRLSAILSELALNDRGADEGRMCRAYGLVIQGEMALVARARSDLSDQLDAMGLIDASAQTRLDSFMGTYDGSVLSNDSECWRNGDPLRAEVSTVARSIAHALVEIRSGRLSEPDLLLSKVRAMRRIASN